MAMRAGKMRWPAVIQRKTGTQSTGSTGTGEVTYTWADYLSIRVDVAPLSKAGSKSAWEAVTAAQIKPRKIIQFITRYQNGIDESMRIVFRGGQYDIKSIVDVDTRDRELWLVCEYGLDQG